MRLTNSIKLVFTFFLSSYTQRKSINLVGSLTVQDILQSCLNHYDLLLFDPFILSYSPHTNTFFCFLFYNNKGTSSKEIRKEYKRKAMKVLENI